jgi:hypothetical protein
MAALFYTFFRPIFGLHEDETANVYFLQPR